MTSDSVVYGTSLDLNALWGHLLDWVLIVELSIEDTRRYILLSIPLIQIQCLKLCQNFNLKVIVKDTWILFQFLFLMEKSILYAKIEVSHNYFFFKTQF